MISNGLATGGQTQAAKPHGDLAAQERRLPCLQSLCFHCRMGERYFAVSMPERTAPVLPSLPGVPGKSRSANRGKGFPASGLAPWMPPALFLGRQGRIFIELSQRDVRRKPASSQTFPLSPFSLSALPSQAVEGVLVFGSLTVPVCRRCPRCEIPRL